MHSLSKAEDIWWQGYSPMAISGASWRRTKSIIWQRLSSRSTLVTSLKHWTVFTRVATSTTRSIRVVYSYTSTLALNLPVETLKKYALGDSPKRRSSESKVHRPRTRTTRQATCSCGRQKSWLSEKKLGQLPVMSGLLGSHFTHLLSVVCLSHTLTKSSWDHQIGLYAPSH